MVIAVITILAVLVLPGCGWQPDSGEEPHWVPRVTNAKKYNIACVNNLKQIGVAAFMYAQDNNGILPSTRRRGNATCSMITAGRYRRLWAAALNDYAGYPKAFRCPAENGNCLQHSFTGKAGESLSYGSVPSGGRHRRIVLDEIRFPHECILYGDITTGLAGRADNESAAFIGFKSRSGSRHRDIGSTPLGNGDVTKSTHEVGRLCARHGERFNVVLADGHVEGASIWKAYFKY